MFSCHRLSPANKLDRPHAVGTNALAQHSVFDSCGAICGRVPSFRGFRLDCLGAFLRRDRRVREFPQCRRTGWELPDACVLGSTVTGSFDSANASLREALTALSM